MGRACADCKFSKVLGRNGRSFQCRRYPPLVVLSAGGQFAERFPSVEGFTWCGEFEDQHKPKQEQEGILENDKHDLGDRRRVALTGQPFRGDIQQD